MLCEEALAAAAAAAAAMAAMSGFVAAEASSELPISEEMLSADGPPLNKLLLFSLPTLDELDDELVEEAEEEEDEDGSEPPAVMLNSELLFLGEMEDDDGALLAPCLS